MSPFALRLSELQNIAVCIEKRNIVLPNNGGLGWFSSSPSRVTVFYGFPLR